MKNYSNTEQRYIKTETAPTKPIGFIKKNTTKISKSTTLRSCEDFRSQFENVGNNYESFKNRETSSNPIRKVVHNIPDSVCKVLKVVCKIFRNTFSFFQEKVLILPCFDTPFSKSFAYKKQDNAFEKISIFRLRKSS